jgi:prepilin-type N-terminal cleavage/methylation domain-containing protein
MTAPGRDHPGGFTVVEIMVGITLLAVLLTGVYTVAIGTLQAKRVIDETSAIYTAGPEILDLLDRDLRGAYYYGVADGKAMKAQRTNVGGTEVTIIDLITTSDSKITKEVDDREVRSDVTEIGYRLRRNDDFPGLLELYRREQFFFDDDPLKGGDYYLVYDRVRSIVIDFFEHEKEGETTSSIAKDEGKEDWDSEDDGGLPRAVRITIELAAPEKAGEPDEGDERYYRFVRWVLLPNAFDRMPAGGDDTGPGGPANPGDEGPR